MKQKITKISALFFLFIFPGSGAFAQVQVGNGTAVDENLPIEPYYGYSHSQVIYLASESVHPETLRNCNGIFPEIR
ncbi:MAG: hypothetical protein GXO86_08685 [Chlorobi bacterium]|nr:hypothetical protein [Chlorobiota bacterium]